MLLALSGIAVLGLVSVGVRAVITARPTPAATQARVEAVTALPRPPGTVAAPVEPPLPTISGTQPRWTATWVNVREGPAMDAPILQTLPPAQRVDIANRQGGWWLAYLNGERIGYIANSVLQATPPDS